MKTIFLHFPILLLCLVSASSISAQITITAENFPRQATFADTFYSANPPVVNFPAAGPDQTWDYSNLATDTYFVVEYNTSENEDDFPGALNFYERNLVFQIFDLPSHQYDAIDENGWFDLGRDMADITYPISFITGGANDKLRFVGNRTVFDGRLDNIIFPATYNDSWTQNRREVVPFELTVAAFGLNSVPGQNVRIASHTREIVGYGKLIIPGVDGSASEPIDVLLFDVRRSFADSVYLGGAPAPQALMDIFGLSQGQTSSDQSYVFYRADFGSPVMNFTVGSEFVAYRPQAAFITNSTSEHGINFLSSYPNPAAAGQKITLELNEKIDSGKFQIFNASGKQVFEQNFESYGQDKIDVIIPFQLIDGMHFIRILNKNNRPTASGKLFIKR